jgi:methyltransferase (TIGR00027 family)
LLDADPPVLNDEFAAQLLGTAWSTTVLMPWAVARRRLAARLLVGAPRWAGRFPNGTRRLRAQIVVRSRYAEDRLALAMERGVDQYVILGAGLDTFALRSFELADKLKIFEVDHPETQRLKRSRLEANGLQWPAHCEAVPIDFERQRLDEVLAASGHDAARPTFFSWLGVTYYLSREAIVETLAVVADQATGSEIVFDFWSHQQPRQADRALLQALRFSVAGVGEEMISFFDRNSIRELVEEAGLQVEEILGTRDTQNRYLAGRRDGLVMPDFSFLALAGKPPEPARSRA